MSAVKEIVNREDIKLLVNDFYQAVLCDDLLGPIFEHYDLDWSKHLSTMYDFWDSIIFASGIYKGNPLKSHLDINLETPLISEHFERWISIFVSTVDNHFKGEKAETIKKRATMAANLFYSKIKGIKNDI